MAGEKRTGDPDEKSSDQQEEQHRANDLSDRAKERLKDLERRRRTLGVQRPDEVPYFPFGGEEEEGSAETDSHEPVDSGMMLLEPVTARELGAVERALGVLEEMLLSGRLDHLQQERILAMAELIQDRQREAQLGETKRWEVIGLMKAVVRYLRVDLVKDSLALVKLTEIFNSVEWHSLLELLEGR